MKLKLLNLVFGVFVRTLTEVEFGGFGQGLPPPGPLETHTVRHTFTRPAFILLAGCFVFSSSELATTSSPVAQEQQWEQQVTKKETNQGRACFRVQF